MRYICTAIFALHARDIHCDAGHNSGRIKHMHQAVITIRVRPPFSHREISPFLVLEGTPFLVWDVESTVFSHQERGAKREAKWWPSNCQGPLNGGVSNGGFPDLDLFVLPFLSFFVLFGTFPICSGTLGGFSRLVLFLFLGLLRAPTRNSPERVRDTIWTFPQKSGKHPGFATPLASYRWEMGSKSKWPKNGRADGRIAEIWPFSACPAICPAIFPAIFRPFPISTPFPTP